MVYGGTNCCWKIASVRVPFRTVWGDGMTEKVVWHVVKTQANKLAMPKLAPHDLRRS